MTNLAYSPDGQRLAYWSKELAAGTWDLIVVDAAGANPVIVAKGTEMTPTRLGRTGRGTASRSVCSDARRRRDAMRELERRVLHVWHLRGRG